MSITRVGIPHRTVPIRDRKPQNSGSMLARQYSQTTYPRKDYLNEMETIMRAAMDLDDYDH
jgi:hypothetical protein